MLKPSHFLWCSQERQHGSSAFTAVRSFHGRHASEYQNTKRVALVTIVTCIFLHFKPHYVVKSCLYSAFCEIVLLLSSGTTWYFWTEYRYIISISHLLHFSSSDIGSLKACYLQWVESALWTNEDAELAAIAADCRHLGFALVPQRLLEPLARQFLPSKLDAAYGPSWVGWGSHGTFKT